MMNKNIMESDTKHLVMSQNNIVHEQFHPKKIDKAKHEDYRYDGTKARLKEAGIRILSWRINPP